MLSVRDTSALRSIKGAAVRDASGVLRSVVLGRVREAAGALRTFYSALSASLSTTSVFGYGDGPGSIGITTTSVTATPAGGVAPFTYAWARTDAGAEPWTILSPNSASTAFRATAVPAFETHSATFACTITDANGSTLTTGNVSAEATNNYSGGPQP